MHDTVTSNIPHTKKSTSIYLHINIYNICFICNISVIRPCDDVLRGIPDCDCFILSTKACLAVTLSTRDPTSPAVLFLSVSPWASRASRVNGRQIRDKYHNVSNQAFYSNAIKTCKTIKHLEDL